MVGSVYSVKNSSSQAGDLDMQCTKDAKCNSPNLVCELVDKNSFYPHRCILKLK